MRKGCRYFFVAFLFFCNSLSFGMEISMTNAISDDSIERVENIKDQSKSSISSLCGEFATDYTKNTTNGQITYIFHGYENSIPTSFERIQVCKSSVDPTTHSTNIDYLPFLDVNMTCSITNFGNSLTYSIQGMDVFFSTLSKLAFFECNETTPLNAYIPVASVPCLHPVFDDLAALMNSSHTLNIIECFNAYVSLVIDNYDMVLVDFLGQMKFSFVNENSCKVDALSVVGTFFAFVLVGIFIFLIIFAYNNNNKKASKFIGNGIDVNAKHVISKPFSCAINPYSKKSKEIPVTASNTDVVSSVAVDTIMINQGHSSFYMV